MINFCFVWAYSPMVEHIVRSDEIWVRFSVGPFFISKGLKKVFYDLFAI